MALQFFNPPSKWSCDCFSWAQEQCNLYKGPEPGLAPGSLDVHHSETPIPEPSSVCNDCIVMVADTKSAPRRFWRKSVSQPLDQVLGKRELELEEMETPICWTRVDSFVRGTDKCSGRRIVFCCLRTSIISKVADGRHSPSLKKPRKEPSRTAVDGQTVTMAEQETPSTPRSQRKSPTRELAKRRSKDRHRRVSRIKFPHTVVYNDEMEYELTPSPPSHHARMVETPTMVQSNSNIQAPHPINRNILFPDTRNLVNVDDSYPLEDEVSMDEAPIPSTPIAMTGAGYSNESQAFYPSAAQQTSSAPTPSAPVTMSIAGYSSSLKACQPKRQSQQSSNTAIAANSSKVIQKSPKKQPQNAGLSSILASIKAPANTKPKTPSRLSIVEDAKDEEL